MTEANINQLLLDEIIKNRNEIKNTIETSEARLTQKIEEDKNRLIRLEKENLILKEEIEILKRNNKKNNIIIFGIRHQRTSLTIKFLIQKLKELLGVDLNEFDISDFYTLGNTEESPIKIEFTTYLKKKLILHNCHKLKDTNISINHDLTSKQREDNKLLRKHLQLAKKDKNETCYIRKDVLYVNDKCYTIEDLLELENQEDSEGIKTNSASVTPNPPNTSIQSKYQSEEKKLEKEDKTKKTVNKVSDRIRKRLIK